MPEDHVDLAKDLFDLYEDLDCARADVEQAAGVRFTEQQWFEVKLRVGLLSKSASYGILTASRKKEIEGIAVATARWIAIVSKMSPETRALLEDAHDPNMNAILRIINGLGERVPLCDPTLISQWESAARKAIQQSRPSKKGQKASSQQDSWHFVELLDILAAAEVTRPKARSGNQVKFVEAVFELLLPAAARKRLSNPLAVLKAARRLKAQVRLAKRGQRVLH